MQIVIEIPKGAYEEIVNAKFPAQDAYRLVAWIKCGTPLPKGHGRLIDADAVDTKYSDPEVIETLDNAPTIIEADTESEET